MLNNDVLRRVRYILNLNDQEMIDIFALAENDVSKEQVIAWLKKDDDADFQNLKAIELSIFLNGLISLKRGKRDGEAPAPEKKMTNNLVFRKLIIAFNLKSEEVLEILSLSGFSAGKHELSAFFRKSSHKNYRECKAQILRNFLTGLQLKFRDGSVVK